MLTDDELKDLYNRTGAIEFQKLGLSLTGKGFDGHLAEITAKCLRAVFNAGVREGKSR